MADIPIDKLGGFPIVQGAVAFLIVVFGLAAMWRAFKTAFPPAPSAPAAAAAEQRWYFEGPIAEIFKQLARINQQQERAAEKTERLIDLQEKGNESLEEIARHSRTLAERRR